MADPFGTFEQQLHSALATVAPALGVHGALPITEVPPERTGHLAVPCFVLAKPLKVRPEEAALRLQAALETAASESRIELPGSLSTAGGFLNLTLEPARLAASVLEAVQDEGARYGHWPSSGTTVLLEHTSANPTGPFHVGRARNPILGDTLARVLRAAGDIVEVHYWVNDVGKQVVILSWGVEHMARLTPSAAEREKPDHQLVTYYQQANAAMETDPTVAAAVDARLRALESGDRSAREAVASGVREMLVGMQQTLRDLDVTIDVWDYESSLISDGSTKAVVEGLSSSPHAGVEEGAHFLDLAALGLGGKERFYFTRGDGTSLYTTRDVAYHRAKARKADRLINILGEDHKQQAAELAAALKVLDVPTLPESVFYSFVALPEGRMSTRSGRVVFIDDLIEESVKRAEAEVRARRPELSPEEWAKISRHVGIGALRYNLVRVKAAKNITFSWEEALSFDGDSAPFLQYSHARCAAILRKAAGAPAASSVQQFSTLTDQREQALLWTIGRFPSLVRQCATTLEVHHLPSYLNLVATECNRFYEHCPVLGAPQQAARLSLVAATKQTLGNGLRLLGIEPLEQM